MKTHKWADIEKKHFTDAEIADAKIAAAADLLEMDLPTLRRFVGKTQVELARAIEISQAELSRAEKRKDHKLSTLRRLIEAMGGKLELVAHFGETTVRLKEI